MHWDGLSAVRGSDGRVRLRRFCERWTLGEVRGLACQNPFGTVVVDTRRGSVLSWKMSGGHVTLVDFTGVGHESTQGDRVNRKC